MSLKQRISGPSDIVEVFRDCLTTGPIPTESQVHLIASSLCPKHVTPTSTNDDFVRDVGAPLWDNFRALAYSAREALRKLRNTIPAEDWKILVSTYQGLEFVHRGLEEMDRDLFEDDVAPKENGRPTDPEKYCAALSIALEVKDVLKRCGHKNKISLTSTSGPVARIGARLWAAGVSDKNVLPPETFAGWVRRGVKLMDWCETPDE